MSKQNPMAQLGVSAPVNNWQEGEREPGDGEGGAAAAFTVAPLDKPADAASCSDSDDDETAGGEGEAEHGPMRTESAARSAAAAAASASAVDERFHVAQSAVPVQGNHNPERCSDAAAADGDRAAAAAGAAASGISPISPREPQEPIDRSVLGPAPDCRSFIYGPGGDAPAKEHFACPLSKRPLLDPVKCPEGHYNCRGCLYKQGQGQCAVCKKPIGEGAAVDPAVRQLLDGLRVQCPDCGEVVARDRLLHHRNALCQLPCERRCGSSVARLHIADHEPVCPLLIVECEAADFGCKWRGVRCEQAAHHAVCKPSGVLPALRLLIERLEEQQITIAALGARLHQQDTRVEELEGRAKLQQATVVAQAQDIERLQQQLQEEQTRVLQLAEQLAEELRDRAAADSTLAAQLAQETAHREQVDAGLSERLTAVASLSPDEPLTKRLTEQQASIDLLRAQAIEQGTVIEDHQLHIAQQQATLAQHMGALQWHVLGDEFCTKKGVKLTNGWEPYSPDEPFRFAMDAHGFVHLGGVIKGGKADNEKVVLTLPEGYCPAHWQCLPVDSGFEFGEVQISTAGGVVVRVKGKQADWLSFNGITFSTV